MGTIVHHAIVVTGSMDTTTLKRFEKAHQKAVELFGPSVTGIVPSRNTDFGSFLIAPDGSSEGWPISNEYDEKRKVFTDFVDSLAWEDGSTGVKFVEVAYDQEHTVTVVTTNKQIQEEY